MATTLPARLAGCLAVFLLGLSGKLWLVAGYGSGTPDPDQWWGEMHCTLAPLVQGRFSWATLFAAHCEHHIVWTRLLTIVVWFVAGRRWDPRLECVADAVLHCGTFALMGWVVSGLMPRRTWPSIFGCLAAALMLPFAWENTLCGFQSQFHFMILFTFLAIWLCSTRTAGNWRWWAGLACCAAALGTMASGFFAAAILGGLGVLRSWRRPLSAWLEAFFAMEITLIGLHLILKVTNAEPLRVKTVGAFFAAFSHDVEWPWMFVPFIWILAPLPLIAILQGGWSRAKLLAVLLSAWVVLQCAAMAFQRGGAGEYPVCRYRDIICLLPLCCGLIIATTPWLRNRFLFRCVWPFVMVLGLGGASMLALQNADYYRQLQAARDAEVQNWLATGNACAFSNVQFSPAPNDGPQVAASLLREAKDCGLLPVANSGQSDWWLALRGPCCIAGLVLLAFTGISHSQKRPAHGRSSLQIDS